MATLQLIADVSGNGNNGSVTTGIPVVFNGSTAGKAGSIGVGGTWPALSYANLAAMNADSGQADNTHAYLQTNGLVYNSQSGVWHQGMTEGFDYYGATFFPLSLVTTITGVNGNTLTLAATSTVATTNANVWLDCLPSFYILNQAIPVGGSSPTNPNNVTLSIPAGNWRMSTLVQNPNNGVVPGNGWTITGAGIAQTTLINPTGCQGGAFNLNELTGTGLVVQNFGFVGNLGDNGYGFVINLSGNGYGGNPLGTNLVCVGSPTGFVMQNLASTNDVGGAYGINTATNCLIQNCTRTITQPQRDYLGWGVSLANCTGGQIKNCFSTSPWIHHAYEVFSCNGSEIGPGTNCQNGAYSTNSSSNWIIDFRGTTVTFTSDCWNADASGSYREPILNISSNAFHTGGGGIIYLGQIIQQGYIGSWDDTSLSGSLNHMFITGDQPNTTVIGGYLPGTGTQSACFSSIDGYVQAPDYNAASSQYGGTCIAEGSGQLINGVRVVGAAIPYNGTPQTAGHYGNISFTGSSNKVENCVVDVVDLHDNDAPPTLTNNITNAAFASFCQFIFIQDGPGPVIAYTHGQPYNLRFPKKRYEELLDDLHGDRLSELANPIDPLEAAEKELEELTANVTKTYNKTRYDKMIKAMAKVKELKAGRD